MHAQPRPESRSVLTLALDVLTQPVDAFRYLAQHSHMGLGLLVYVVSQLPASLAPQWAWDGPPVAAATPGLAGVALGAISNLAELLVGALVLHGAATLLGGRNGYSKILQAEAFSALPLLLTAPFAALAHAAGVPTLYGLPAFAAVAWSVVLTVIGVRETYSVTTGRAVAAFVLAVVFLIIVALAFALAFGLSLLPAL